MHLCIAHQFVYFFHVQDVNAPKLHWKCLCGSIEMATYGSRRYADLNRLNLVHRMCFQPALNMFNFSLCSEKSPWKGARRCLYVSMLSLMLGVLTIYCWFSLSWSPSVDLMKGLSLTYNGGNKTTTVKSVSLFLVLCS